METTPQPRDGHPEPSPLASSALEQVLEQHYRAFFEEAEEKRRWSLTNDIPWAEVKRAPVGEDLVSIIESYWCVEMFLPDYSQQLLSLCRRSRGLAWFLLNWGYEEAKHSRAISEWLIRSGNRTERQMDEMADRLLSKEWQRPFQTIRQMMIYTTIQELATQVNYLGVEKLSREIGDPALRKVLLLVSADEGKHHRFYADVVRGFLVEDRAGTIEDLAYVLSKFEMPAHEVIPNWSRYAALIEGSGVYTGKVFLRRVLLPVLEKLEVSRHELRAARVTIEA